MNDVYIQLQIYSPSPNFRKPSNKPKMVIKLMAWCARSGIINGRNSTWGAEWWAHAEDQVLRTTLFHAEVLVAGQLNRNWNFDVFWIRGATEVYLRVLGGARHVWFCSTDAAITSKSRLKVLVTLWFALCKSVRWVAHESVMLPCPYMWFSPFFWRVHYTCGSPLLNLWALFHCDKGSLWKNEKKKKKKKKKKKTWHGPSCSSAHRRTTFVQRCWTHALIAGSIRSSTAAIRCVPRLRMKIELYGINSCDVSRCFKMF